MFVEKSADIFDEAYRFILEWKSGKFQLSKERAVIITCMTGSRILRVLDTSVGLFLFAQGLFQNLHSDKSIRPHTFVYITSHIMPIVKDPLNDVKKKIQEQSIGITPSPNLLHEIIVSSTSAVMSEYIELGIPSQDFAWETWGPVKVSANSIYNVFKYVLGEILLEYEDSADLNDIWASIIEQLNHNQTDSFNNESSQSNL